MIWTCNTHKEHFQSIDEQMPQYAFAAHHGISLLPLNFRNTVSGTHVLTNDIFCTLAFSFHCDHTFLTHFFQQLCCL